MKIAHQSKWGELYDRKHSLLKDRLFQQLHFNKDKISDYRIMVCACKNVCWCSDKKVSSMEGNPCGVLRLEEILMFANDSCARTSFSYSGCLMLQ